MKSLIVVVLTLASSTALAAQGICYEKQCDDPYQDPNTCPYVQIKCEVPDFSYVDVVEDELLKQVDGTFVPGKTPDPSAWVRASNRYANKRNLAGYPTFLEGSAGKYQVQYIAKTNWQDVPENELIAAYPDLKGNFGNPSYVARASNRWAAAHGHYGGLSTMEVLNGKRGVHTFTKQVARFIDIPAAELTAAVPEFKADGGDANRAGPEILHSDVGGSSVL